MVCVFFFIISALKKRVLFNILIRVPSFFSFFFFFLKMDTNFEKGQGFFFFFFLRVSVVLKQDTIYEKKSAPRECYLKGTLFSIVLKGHY